MVVAPFILGGGGIARAGELVTKEWERVYLPIDPGVVLLDIAFVPEDPQHGIISWCCFAF